MPVSRSVNQNMPHLVRTLIGFKSEPTSELNICEATPGEYVLIDIIVKSFENDLEMLVKTHHCNVYLTFLKCYHNILCDVFQCFKNIPLKCTHIDTGLLN